jgi:hypothetical protein
VCKQTLEAKMGPALALTREALREELATVEARAHEELGAMAERLGAELAIRCVCACVRCGGRAVRWDGTLRSNVG